MNNKFCVVICYDEKLEIENIYECIMKRRAEEDASLISYQIIVLDISNK